MPENEHADSVNSKTRYKRSQTAPCRVQALNANIRSITVILFCKKWLTIGEQNDFEGRAYKYEKGLQQCCGDRAAVFFFNSEGAVSARLYLLIPVHFTVNIIGRFLFCLISFPDLIMIWQLQYHNLFISHDLLF